MANQDELIALIGQLQQQAAQAAPFDLATVMPVADGLEALGPLLAGAGGSTAANLADSAMNLANDLIMDLAGDPREALADVSQAIDALHGLIVDGQDPSTASIPARFKLNLDDTPATASTDANTSADADTAVQHSQSPPDQRHPADPMEESNPAVPVIPGNEYASALQPSDHETEVADIPEYVDPAVFEDFLERRLSLVDELEHLVLDLEQRKEAAKQLDLKGQIHTLKGEGGVLGLMDLEAVCHAMETHLGDGQTIDTDVLLEAIDWARTYLQSWADKSRRPTRPQALIARLEGSDSAPAVSPPPAEAPRPPTANLSDDDPTTDFPGPARASEASAGQPPAPPAVATPLPSKAIDGSHDPAELAEFVTEALEHLEQADLNLLELEHHPDNLETINALFRSFHTIKGLSGFFGASAINRIAHETENLLDRGRIGALKMTSGLVDAIFEAVDLLRKQATAVQRYIEEGITPEVPPKLDLFLERVRQAGLDDDPNEGSGNLTVESLTQAFSASQRATEEQITKAVTKAGNRDPVTVARTLVEAGVVTARQAAQVMRNAKQVNQPGAKVVVREAIKVDSDRLERLIDLIGELVIAESMVCQSQDILAYASPQTQSQLAQLDKITRELQELGTSLRMVPVRATFQRMARMVRDLSKKMAKPVEFQMNGEETELDKTVVDRIGDPLVHMIRNAIDHGLEANAAEREAAGKPPHGTVTLRAFHKGGSIYIEIADDGRGLNREKILTKAIERDIINPDDAGKMADRDVWQLIFSPGFSTAAEVTEVSGRGVGMDVVKRNIEALRGTVEITTQPGAGTTFSIRLPLTLAVIDGMVVRIGEERYIVPTLSIVSSVRPQPSDLSTCVQRGEVLQLHGELMTLHRLDRVLEVTGAIQDPTEALVVVVEDDGRRVGLLVDELLGQQQVVIKSLGEALGNVEGIAGGAILPDGRVGLIVDISGMVRLAETQPGNTAGELVHH